MAAADVMQVLLLSWRQALHHVLVYQSAGCTQHGSGHWEAWRGLCWCVYVAWRGVGATVVSIQETPSGAHLLCVAVCGGHTLGPAGREFTLCGYGACVDTPLPCAATTCAGAGPSLGST
jgi:hypothetical protein